MNIQKWRHTCCNVVQTEMTGTFCVHPNLFKQFWGYGFSNCHKPNFNVSKLPIRLMT